MDSKTPTEAYPPHQARRPQVGQVLCADLPLILGDLQSMQAAFRIAARKLHPDSGGNAEQFDLLTKARDTLKRHHK